MFYDLFHIIHSFVSQCFSLYVFFWLISALILSFVLSNLLKLSIFKFQILYSSVLEFSFGFLKIVFSSLLKFYNLAFRVFSKLIIVILKSIYDISSVWTFCGLAFIIVFFSLFQPYIFSLFVWFFVYLFVLF